MGGGSAALAGDTPANTSRVREAAKFIHYLNAARTIDVSTAPDRAVSYSGPGNKAVADQYAASNGASTIETTPGGSWLDNEKFFGPDSGTSTAHGHRVAPAATRQPAFIPTAGAVPALAKRNAGYGLTPQPSTRTGLPHRTYTRRRDGRRNASTRTWPASTSANRSHQPISRREPSSVNGKCLADRKEITSHLRQRNPDNSAYLLSDTIQPSAPSPRFKQLTFPLNRPKLLARLPPL